MNLKVWLALKVLKILSEALKPTRLRNPIVGAFWDAWQCPEPHTLLRDLEVVSRFRSRVQRYPMYIPNPR